MLIDEWRGFDGVTFPLEVEDTGVVLREVEGAEEVLPRHPCSVRVVEGLKDFLGLCHIRSPAPLYIPGNRPLVLP